jgi:hypothetical protein
MRTRRAGWLIVTACAFSVGACGGSDAPPSTKTTAKSAAADNAAKIAGAQKAAAGFVTSVREGDGAAACKVLTDVEQGIFVTGAAEIRPKLDTTSCASVVESYQHSMGEKSRLLLDGSLTNVQVTDDFASGMWSWTGANGEQAAILENNGQGWQFGRDSNDFPTAVLHFFDRG